MDWLKAIAPTIATALAGPLAGAAVTIIADILGVTDATKDSIKDVLSKGNLTPEQLAAIKDAEIKFKQRCIELGLDIEKVAAGDRDSARKMQIETKSWIPGILATIVVGGWIAVQYVVLFHTIDGEMRELALRMFGTLDAALMLVLSFYFGSSASSKDKDRVIAAIGK